MTEEKLLSKDELLVEYIKLQSKKKEIEEELNNTKLLLKLHLQRENIDSYEDSLGNTIKIYTQKRETLDKEKVKVLLSPEDYENVIKISTFEIIRILSKDSNDKQKHFLKVKK